MHNERLTLATLCGGAVQEKVDRALEKVAKNILDPNTDPGKKRSITLKIVLKPDEDDKEDVEVTADVTVSLAAEVGVSTQFYVSKDLEKDTVSIMEHKKGEIKGQLDFSDIDMDAILKEEKAKEEQEQPEAKVVGGVVDFRVSR
jgi:hypothetical protein